MTTRVSDIRSRYIPRILDLQKKLAVKSHFLFGPRQTGKTTLIERSMPGIRTYNLLRSDVYRTLSARPETMREEITDSDDIVVIDEIQKLPQLLDEVQLLIEERGIRFLLTGSSARKLRRGGVNLLGGRARVLSLHPLVRRELGKMDLLRVLNHGLLPSVHLSDDPDADLQAYAGTYLREEIAAEGLSRNIPAYSRFLQVAALCNAQIINTSKIANDAQVARTTVHEYFEVLKDTLIAHALPAFKQSVKRKPIKSSKLYFFDTGVVRHLCSQGRIQLRSPAFGEAFETYLMHELRSYLSYSGKGSLAYWRSTSKFEVDFILDERIAIEVKGKDTIGGRDLRGLRALREEELLDKYFLVCLERRPRIIDGIEILPWEMFLDRLWDGDLDT